LRYKITFYISEILYFFLKYVRIPVISGFKSYVKDKQLVEDGIASMKQRQNDFNKNGNYDIYNLFTN